MGMINYFEKEMPVAASQCDYAGNLSVRAVFDIFMDAASEHAALLGVGYYDMLRQHCYWVAARTRVKMHKPAPMWRNVTVQTWPTAPTAVKCDRCYRIVCGDELIAEGRTEWAVQDTETGRLRRTDSIGYPQIEHRRELVCEDKFARFPNIVSDGAQLFGRYTVTSSDIDVGAHMNNVAYIRMLMGLFSVQELRDKPVKEMEIAYRLGCFEGEALSVYRRDEPDGAAVLQINKPDGTAAAHARIVR